MQEIWKPIKGFEELYQISNLGRAKRIGFYKKTNNGKIVYIKNEKMLKPTNYKKYMRLNLCNKSKRTPKYIHRLVAEAFIPNPYCYSEINHKDNDPSNNYVDNLEWCDRGYNIAYMIKHQSQILERHEKRIETLETLLYLANTNDTVDSSTIKELITKELVGDF